MKYYSSNGRNSGLGGSRKNYDEEVEEDDFEDLEDFERDGFSLSI